LVDGFKAAQVMLNEDPSNVEMLIDFPQPFHSSGNEDVCIQPGRSVSVLERDSWSRMLYQVRWNNYDRSAKVNWEIRDQKDWYTAARHWNAIIHRPDMEIWLQLEPGTALSM
jgi:trimethyllysine dioxygenase